MKKNLLLALLIPFSILFMSFSMMGKKPSLKDAVNAQDTEKVKELLAQGADPNEKIAAHPVLYWATAWSNCDIIKLLLDAGAEVNSVDGSAKDPALSALAEAYEPDSALRKNIAMNETLIRRVKGDTAKVAKWLAHTDITRFSTVYDRAKLLLSYGADPNIVTVFNSPFLMSLVKMQKPAIKAMIESGKVNMEQCYFAIDLDVKKATKDWKVSPEQMTPLMFAVGMNDFELVKLFVEAGADIKVTKNFEGKQATAIIMSAVNNNQEIFEYLTEKSGGGAPASAPAKLGPGTYCVAFVMEKQSSSLGTRSITYACRYIQIESTKTASDTELASAARDYVATRYGSSGDSYTEKEVFFFSKVCNDCKNEINAKYQLSDSMVDYMSY